MSAQLLIAAKRVSQASSTMKATKTQRFSYFLPIGQKLDITVPSGNYSALFIDDPRYVNLTVTMDAYEVQPEVGAFGLYTEAYSTYHLISLADHTVSGTIFIIPSTITCDSVFYTSGSNNNFEISLENEANVTMDNNQKVCFFASPKITTEVNIETDIESNFDYLYTFFPNQTRKRYTSRSYVSFKSSEPLFFYYISDSTFCNGEVDIELKSSFKNDYGVTKSSYMRYYNFARYSVFISDHPIPTIPTATPTRITTITAPTSYYTRTYSTKTQTYTWYPIYTYTYSGNVYTYTRTMTYGIPPTTDYPESVSENIESHDVSDSFVSSFVIMAVLVPFVILIIIVVVFVCHVFASKGVPQTGADVEMLPDEEGIPPVSYLPQPNEVAPGAYAPFNNYAIPHYQPQLVAPPPGYGYPFIDSGVTYQAQN
jgi:hypothetical protein